MAAPHKAPETRWAWIGTIAIVLVAAVGFALRPSHRLGSKPHPTYDALISAIRRQDSASAFGSLAKGSDPNWFPQDEAALASAQDVSPLDVAIDEGSPGMVKLLLDRGADPNQGDGHHWNPLSAAASPFRESILQLLIDHGAKVNDGKAGSGALWKAALSREPGAVQFLLAHGANPNSTSEAPHVRLIRAVTDPEIARILKAAGAKP